MMPINRSLGFEVLGIVALAIWPLSGVFAQLDPDPWSQLYAPFMRDQRARPEYPRIIDKAKQQKDAFAQLDSNLTLFGLWPWGPCTAVAAREHYAFIGNGGLFQVFDLSNPVQPEILGEVFWGQSLAYDIKLKGIFAFVADGNLKVIAISDPARPQRVAALYLPETFAVRILISGNYAYVGSLGAIVSIVDISTPTSPFVKNTFRLSDDFVKNMAIYEDHLFIKTEHPLAPIYIIDVSDHNNPRLAGFYAQCAYAFDVSGNRLYLTVDDSSFQVVDLTTPATPRLISRIQVPFRGRAMSIKDSLAYVTGENPLLAVMDVTNASTPSLRGTAYGSPGTSVSIAVAYPLVLANTGLGFWSFDVRNPDQPLTSLHFPTIDFALNVNVVDIFAFLATWRTGLFIVDVSKPSNPKFVANFLTAGSVVDVAVIDSLAYLVGNPFMGNGSPALSILDVSEPFNPKMLSSVPVLPKSIEQGISPSGLTHGFFFPAWNDFRNSTVQNPENTDVYFARVNRGPASNSGLATAWANARKSVYTTNNSRWHQIFQSNSQVIHAYSTDDGVTWQDYNIISGQASVSANSSPVLAMRNSFLYSIFSSNQESGGYYRIYFNRNSTGTWLATPFVLYSTSAEVSQLSFAMASDGTGHVVWVEGQQLLLGPNAVKHGTFNVTAGTPTLGNITTIYSTGTSSNPALTLDSNNKPHAGWSVSNEIRYSNKTGSSWSSSTNLNNNAGVSQNPSILSNGTTIYATWHDNTPGNYEIYYRVRTGSSWSATQNLSNSPASSTYPCLGGPVNNAPAALWVENVSGNNEIKYAWVGQASSGLLATTLGPSSYPAFTTRSIAGGTRILGLWTEGSASPFFIQDNFVDLVPLAKPWVKEERHVSVPPAFALYPSYPNPFNPASTIQYDLPEAALVQLVILNMLGQEVARLVDGWQPSGRYQVNWRSGGHPSGVYFCRLRAGEFVAMRKMNLLHCDLLTCTVSHSNNERKAHETLAHRACSAGSGVACGHRANRRGEDV